MRGHKCFLWSHVRLIDPQDRNAERIIREDKKIASKLNYSNIDFPLNINDYKLIEHKFNINVNVKSVSIISFKKNLNSST